MRRATRIVERLHLRADSETAVRRALPILEDAFRTATLPDGGARLIFVRRLNLGRLPKGASAQSLSLLLETRFTAAGWRLVHAREAGPEGGQAVWFRDSLEAHELAALYVAAGRSVEAWFWPLAVPALARATSAGDRLRAIAFSLASHEEAPAALPAWVASLERAGHGERLIAALRPGDGTALLHAARVPDAPAGGRSDPSSVARSNAAAVYRSDALPARPTVLSRGGSAFTASDDRLEFIEQILRRKPWRPSGGPPSSSVVERRSAKSSDERNETHRQPARHADARGAMAESTDPSRVASVDAPVDVAAPKRAGRDSAALAHRRQRVPAGDPYSEPMCDAGKAEPSIPGDARSNASHIDGAASPWALPGAVPTAAGGLLFLVPALERLGFGEWCATCDAAHLPAPDALARQIVHVLLSRLRIAEDDPAWQLAASADQRTCAPEGVTSPAAAVAPAEFSCSHSTVPITGHRVAETQSSIFLCASASLWPVSRSLWGLQDDGSRAPWPMPDLRIHCNATIPEIWLAACRCWLRRRARIGLATLVVRPARLALTETHADVFFGLNAADVRVRRAGLDIDPGWVPWLAKVVTFHYQDQPWT